MRELRDEFQADRAAIEGRIRELVQTATAGALLEANNVLLEQNTKQFAAQREETIKNVEGATKPLTDGIQRLQQSVVELDKARAAGAESLKATLETMARSDDSLRQTVERSTTETAKLATALRDNRVRGRWGEIGLRNVLDKVGLTDFCDFVEQAGNEDGKRPDVLIRLPGDREIAVDAKVPFEAYMSALEATDPAEQQRLLAENANALRVKVRDLAAEGVSPHPKGGRRHDDPLRPNRERRRGRAEHSAYSHGGGARSRDCNLEPGNTLGVPWRIRSRVVASQAKPQRHRDRRAGARDAQAPRDLRGALCCGGCKTRGLGKSVERFRREFRWPARRDGEADRGTFGDLVRGREIAAGDRYRGSAGAAGRGPGKRGRCD